jgi:hypothetical protein
LISFWFYILLMLFCKLQAIGFLLL